MGSRVMYHWGFSAQQIMMAKVGDNTPSRNLHMDDPDFI